MIKSLDMPSPDLSRMYLSDSPVLVTGTEQLETTVMPINLGGPCNLGAAYPGFKRKIECYF